MRGGYIALCRAQVDYYRKHGLYTDRIARDGQGVLYVIGDWSWNRRNPNRTEIIDHTLPRFVDGEIMVAANDKEPQR